MSKRNIILICVIFAACIVFTYMAFRRASISSATAEGSISQRVSAVSAVPPLAPPGEYTQISLKTMSKEEALRNYLERKRADTKYDWKIALTFYGLVIDEDKKPVPEANVYFEWTTVGTPGNGAQLKATSDGNGKFSLTGQHGKNLGVRVQKEGYYPVNSGAWTSFEFADPSSPEWYEPDPNSPVIFRVRKKGEGAHLFTKGINFSVHNHPARTRVNLMQGLINSNGALAITADFSKFLPGNQPFPWNASLNMTEGGLVETDDPFPFMAPTKGYTSFINFDMTNTGRSVWQDGVKKTYYFYLPSANTYGRMTITISSGLPVELSYVYNLTPGDRNLEPASQ